MWTLNTHPKHSVHVTQTDEHYDCHTNESLLKGMLRLGRKGIPVGCVNGGCGVCKVRIVEGSVRALGPVSRAHVSAEEEQQGYTLACRAAPVAAVRLQICERLAKPFARPACPTISPPRADAGAAPASFTTTQATKET